MLALCHVAATVFAGPAARAAIRHGPGHSVVIDGLAGDDACTGLHESIVLLAGPCRHDDNTRVRLGLARRADHGVTVYIRHVQVREDGVERAAGQSANGISTARERRDLVAVRVEQASQPPHVSGFVINDKKAGHVATQATRVPCAGLAIRLV